MEKFIKDYGILILVGVGVYYFFIRKKDEEPEVVVIETADDASDYSRRIGEGKGAWERGKDRGRVGGGGACYCANGSRCTCGGSCPGGGTCSGAGMPSKFKNGRRKLIRKFRVRDIWR